MPAATRRLTLILANAAGRMILRSRSTKVISRTSATSSSRGSIAFTTEIVTIRIGHTHAYATMVASMDTPKPNIISASGINATAGIGRSASMVGSTTRPRTGERPVSYTHLRAHETVLDL